MTCNRSWKSLHAIFYYVDSFCTRLHTNDLCLSNAQTFCCNSHAFTATLTTLHLGLLLFRKWKKCFKESQNTWGYHFLKWQNKNEKHKICIYLSLNASFRYSLLYILAGNAGTLKLLIFLFGNKTWHLNVQYMMHYNT